jgi:hypothetical protein
MGNHLDHIEPTVHKGEMIRVRYLVAALQREDPDAYVAVPADFESGSRLRMLGTHGSETVDINEQECVIVYDAPMLPIRHDVGYRTPEGDILEDYAPGTQPVPVIVIENVVDEPAFAERKTAIIAKGPQKQ